jgi:hypothetical protein
MPRVILFRFIKSHEQFQAFFNIICSYYTIFFFFVCKLCRIKGVVVVDDDGVVVKQKK